MYDDIKNRLTQLISLVSSKTGIVNACLLYIKNISFKQAIIFTTLLLLALGTVPFMAPTPTHAMLAQPTTEADCVKAGGKWTYVTGGGANPFVCNVPMVQLMTPQEEAMSYSYYSGLRRCVANTDGAAGPGMAGTIKSSASQDGNVGPSSWFNNDGSSNVVVYPYAQVSCADAMSKALTLWGYGSDYKGFLTAIGYQYNTALAQWSGPSDGTMRWNQFSTAVQSKVYGGVAPSLSSAAVYINSVDSFLSSRCRATDLGIYNDITNSTYRDYIDSNHSESASNNSVKDIIPNAQGNINFAKVTIINPTSGNLEIHGYAYQSNGGGALGCADLPAVITKNAPGWIAWIAAHPGRTDVNPPAIKDGTVGGGPTNTSSCNIDGIGWIICPVVNFLSGIVDASYGIVSSLLTTPALNTNTTSSSNGAYKAWSVMRTFANVVFVIAFIVIIYSQLTGAGINNYGIKKMLPKLIIAAILVNVSYWICAIAVDLSNILGSSLKGLLDGITASLPSNSASTWSTGSNVFAGIAATLLVAGAAMYIGLAVFLPILITVLFAIVTALIVLILRQALIILLIIISPLAFVAFLLPNTESYFKKWRQLFQTLLLMFPIIAVIFGASTLASKIVNISVTGADTGEAQKIMTQIVAAGIAIIPLFITPIVMKTAGGLLSRFGGIVNNPNKGPFDRMKKGASRIRENQQNKRAIRSMNGGRVFGGGQFRRKAKRDAVDQGIKSELNRSTGQYVAKEIEGNTDFRNRVAGGSRGTYTPNATEEAMRRAMDSAQFTIQKAEVEEVKAANARIDRAALDLNALRDISLGKAGAGRTGKFEAGDKSAQNAAIQNIVAAGDIQGIRELMNNSHSLGADAQRTLADALMQKRPAFVGAGAVSEIRQGNRVDTNTLVQGAIEQGVYSVDALAKADRDEIALVADNITAASVSAAARAKVQADANTAMTDPRFNAGKNRENLGNVVGGLPGKYS